MNRQDFTHWEWVQAILRWSALPGASRHHWGSDCDIFDAAALQPGYQLQLTVAETEPNGIFGPFYQWLEQQMERQDFGFFRPYAKDTGGIAPEPWHLSYRPIAESYQNKTSIQALESLLQTLDLELKSTVLEHLNDIYQRFVLPP